MIRKLLQSHRKFFIFFIFGILSAGGSGNYARAQVIGARELSMGQAVTALQKTSWAVFGNPAMMPKGKASVSFFGVRYYGFAEITDMAVSLQYPTTYGVWAGGVHRYGFDLFSESRLRLGYKNSFKGFHFGAVFNYSHVAQGGGNGSAGAIGVDLGIAAAITPELWIGAKAVNINRPTYGSLNDEELPRNLSIGFSYRLSDIALLSSDVIKDVRFPISYRAGIEVRVIGGLVGRAGITTSPNTFSAGFGYNGTFWSANVGVQRHENVVLGYSPAIDFKITW